MELNQYRTHEKAVNDFFKSKGLREDTALYPHSDVFAKAKAISKQDSITHRDRKIFGKFCRCWVQTKGDIKPARLTKIKKMLSYYEQRQSNHDYKQARLLAKAQRKALTD